MISQGNCRLDEHLFGIEVSFSFLETGLLNGDSLEFQSVFIFGALVRHSGTILASADFFYYNYQEF